MKRLGAVIKTIWTSEYFNWALRVYIGWIFFDASLSKIPDPAIFAESVANYRIIPYWGINLTAVILPWLELVCAFYLVFGLRTKATAAILFGLLSVFTIFVIINIFRGANMTCGCFDVVGEPIGWKKVIYNIIWLLMTLQIFFFDRILNYGRTGATPQKKQPLSTSA